jgi:hypothetical protein
MALYLAGNNHSSHHPNQWGILFQTDGAGVCGCDIEVQGSGFRVKRSGFGGSPVKFAPVKQKRQIGFTG